jgi:hypothetical protein
LSHSLKIHPNEEKKMSLNRLFAVFVVLTLLLVAGLTIRSAVATSALVSADRTYDPIERLRAQRDSLSAADRSYDEIEQIRSARDAGRVFDISYDEVEHLRAQRDSLNAVDRSYDEIEHIRSQRDALNATRTLAQ